MQSLEDKISIGNSVHGIVHETIESKLLCHSLAVDVEGVSSQSAGAERTAVDTLGHFAEAFEVGGEGCGVREQPVRPSDRLRFLEMGITRHLCVEGYRVAL